MKKFVVRYRDVSGKEYFSYETIQCRNLSSVECRFLVMSDFMMSHENCDWVISVEEEK